MLRGTYAFHSMQRYCDNMVCISTSWTNDTQFNALQTIYSLDIVRRRLRVGGAQSILRVINELLFFLFFFESIFFLFTRFRISSNSCMYSDIFGHMRTVPIFLFWDRIVGYKTHYATAVILLDSDRHIESLGF